MTCFVSRSYNILPFDVSYYTRTQYESRSPVLKTIPQMVFGTRILKCWVLGPSGYFRLLSGILIYCCWFLGWYYTTCWLNKYLLFSQGLLNSSTAWVLVALGSVRLFWRPSQHSGRSMSPDVIGARVDSSAGPATHATTEMTEPPLTPCHLGHGRNSL